MNLARDEADVHRPHHHSTFAGIDHAVTLPLPWMGANRGSPGPTSGFADPRACTLLACTPCSFTDDSL